LGKVDPHKTGRTGRVKGPGSIITEARVGNTGGKTLTTSKSVGGKKGGQLGSPAAQMDSPR